MYVIGLTGGVGSGKTEAAHFLSELANAELLLADELGHRVMETGTPGYQRIVDCFGRQILEPDGAICRSVLARLVFADKKKLQQLNDIVHPAVREYLRCYIADRRQKDGYIVLESAILFETGCEALCDEVWYLFVPARLRQERLAQSRGYSAEKTEQIMKEQLTEEEFRKRCPVVICNDGSKADLRKRLQEALISIPNGTPEGAEH